jgi:hypothetical protein
MAMGNAEVQPRTPKRRNVDSYMAGRGHKMCPPKVFLKKNHLRGGEGGRGCVETLTMSVGRLYFLEQVYTPYSEMCVVFLDVRLFYAIPKQSQTLKSFLLSSY